MNCVEIKGFLLSKEWVMPSHSQFVTDRLIELAYSDIDILVVSASKALGSALGFGPFHASGDVAAPLLSHLANHTQKLRSAMVAAMHSVRGIRFEISPAAETTNLTMLLDLVFFENGKSISRSARHLLMKSSVIPMDIFAQFNMIEQSAQFLRLSQPKSLKRLLGFLPLASVGQIVDICRQFANAHSAYGDEVTKQILKGGAWTRSRMTQ
jgi:hypothetical protein